MKLILVGMPGCGKSTIGKQLSDNLNLTFFDLDALIEKESHTTIPQLFSDKGEAFFREVERDVLRYTVLQKEDFVLSTGGGAPVFHDNMKWMNQHATTIYLDVPLDELQSRLLRQQKSGAKRPLIDNKTMEEVRETLERLYNQRHSVYQNAHIVVSGPSLSALVVATALRHYHSF